MIEESDEEDMFSSKVLKKKNRRIQNIN